MRYFIDEVTFNNRDFKNLGFASEEWALEGDVITTPHGDLWIDSYIFVNQNGLVGIQFDVDGILALGDYAGCPSNVSECPITTIAFMRQPHNAWLWAYLFSDGQPVASFCGHDELDGFAQYAQNLRQNC